MTATTETTISLFAAALADIAGLPDDTVARCAAHWELVARWNSRTNLTAIEDAGTAAHVHYRDSLEGLRWLTDGPIVDFGSGAGFPGMVLALARPAWRFTLVEPRRKRVSFLEAAAARLGIRNVQVRLGRLEDAPDGAYAHAVTRATFSDPQDLVRCQRWLQPGGTLLAYRAPDEKSPVPHGVATRVGHDYRIAGAPRVIETWTFTT